MISIQKTKVQEIKSQLFEQMHVRVLVKREDLNHPFVSGNKWWKLKYNLEQAFRLGHRTLLTFGGAYSNHIYAAAGAARELGLKSIGIIRGEEHAPLNRTLAFAEACGMKLYYVSREEYRHKSEEEFIKKLHGQFGEFYLIPEGGTNELALKGVVEFGSMLLDEVDFDYLCLPIGTGGTMSGLVTAFAGNKTIVGFSSLKGGGFLHDEVTKWTGSLYTNWSIEEAYHFGGYAKTTEELINFMSDIEVQHQLPLDQVYTAKMLYGVFDLVKKGFFKQGGTVLILHTGGLQGSLLAIKND